MSSTLNHLRKLNQSFLSLINDGDGQYLFEEFAKTKKIDDYLLFWFATEGFYKKYNEIEKKKVENKFNPSCYDSEINNMAKAIYNNFIKKNAKNRIHLWFNNSTRELIYQKIQNSNIDSNLFVLVRNEFERKMEEEFYPLFLKSEIYLNYVKKVQDTTYKKEENNLKSPAKNKVTILKNPYHIQYKNLHIVSNEEPENQSLFSNTNELKSYSMNKNEKILTNEAKEYLKLKATSQLSQLPKHPNHDIEKVKKFIALLEDINKKFNENEKKKSQLEKNDKCNSLRKAKIKESDECQTILDKHSRNVFESNTNLMFNSPKQIFKSYKMENIQNENLNKTTGNNNFIIIMYQYTGEIPYSIKLNLSSLTLKQFKQEIIKKNIDQTKNRFRYFFRKKDLIENMYIMEELIEDNEFVPYCEGKVFAKIEIVPL